MHEVKTPHAADTHAADTLIQQIPHAADTSCSGFSCGGF